LALASNAKWLNPAQWTVRRIAGEYLDYIRLQLSLSNIERRSAYGRSCTESEVSLFPASESCTPGKRFSKTHFR
jgi:hypothetical protein